jgi:tRNA G18 (ribose-2'-O)-methylase SpoU
MGSEDLGISENILAMSDAKISIPVLEKSDH